MCNVIRLILQTCPCSNIIGNDNHIHCDSISHILSNSTTKTINLKHYNVVTFVQSNISFESHTILQRHQAVLNQMLSAKQTNEIGTYHITDELEDLSNYGRLLKN